jgi:two-component system, cell cycle sensor histidine kinase and response regulator CckA
MSDASPESGGLRWEVVLNAAPDAVLLFDPERRVIFANLAAKRLFDRTESTLLGARADELLAGDDAERFAELHDAALAGISLGPARDQSEMGIRREDGSIVPVEIQVGHAAGGGSEQIVICSLRDVTTRRAAAERQARLEASLHRSRRVEAIGQLAGGVAHDFNNLLAVVLNYATFVAEELPADSPMQADLAEIRTAAERGATLTRQLLIFSRRDVSNPEVVDLNEVINGLEKLLQRTLGEHIDLELTLAEDLWKVDVDPAQIEQALLNLVLNGREAMPAGGELRIQTENVELDEVYAEGNPEIAPGAYARVTVTDTGPGIPQEELEHIFEPFYSTGLRGESPGLGLAAVHGVVTAAGGQVAVYSETGMGTAFKVHLPAAEQVASAAPAEPDAAERAWPTGTVLVVEDEPPVLQMAARVLERGGHSVLTAADGSFALDVLAEHPEEVDLILADVVMPVMSGPELAGRVAETRPEMPVVYMSGYTQEMISKQEVISGDVTLIEKPFTAAALLRAVGEALAGAGDEGR